MVFLKRSLYSIKKITIVYQKSPTFCTKCLYILPNEPTIHFYQMSPTLPKEPHNPSKDLLIDYSDLLMDCWTLLIDCGVRLVECRAHLVDCRALLIGSRALLSEYRASSTESRAIWYIIGLFC